MADIAFTIDDLDNAIKRRDPSLADSATYTARRDSAYKQAMAAYEESLVTSDKPFAKGDTFADATAPNTGTAKINTTTGDIFRVALTTNARTVLNDIIWLFNGTTFVQCPRIDPSAIDTATMTAGFWEIKGFIHIYIKEAAITTPCDFHYLYRRALTVTTAPTTTPMDILSEDFTAIVDAVQDAIPKS